jgi:GT2 family glycosyltransferase
VERLLPARVPARIVSLDRNTGFANASNTAAGLGRAASVLFLNADVRVRPGFLAPLAEAIEERPGVAAAGGLQLEGGRVHSCGSEYDPRTRCFEHRLKGCDPSLPDPYLARPGDRDMLTASCLLVRRLVFEGLGGFDTAYRIGYWEDTDLCMKIRAAGWRIRYTPRSVVEHDCNHSGAAGHAYYDANRELFHRRWVDTGVVRELRRERAAHSGISF